MRSIFLWQRAFLPGLVMAALLLGCAQQPDLGGQPQAPIQSPNDDRSYRYIVLENGLRTLLVSDPETEKAAASLDVHVGSASNPPDRGGLAHFLEHMLFLGTEKYPDPAEYEQFITEHGGTRNAYTAFEHTNYFFDVDQAFLQPALDRFAQFFVAPSFDAAYVSREVNAVEAEYQLGIKTDARRNLDVMREIVNPEHPYSILGVGTRETLADSAEDPIREDLLDFYQRYYSANLMSLVVLGRESLDELEAIVRPMFAAVPNRNAKIDDIDVPLHAEGSLPKLVYIQPEASERQLQLSFPLPDYRKQYKRKPLQYIGNLLGHEGKGSLLSLLKAEGLAEGLGAGAGIAYRGGSAFSISVSLTEKGLQQREQVLSRIFEYIHMLQLAGPRRALYEEQARIAALQFRFREKSRAIGYVRALASSMHDYPAEDILRGGSMMSDYQGEQIAEIIARYFTPQNVAITVIGKDVPADRQSEFYFTPYSLEQPTLDAAWSMVSDSKLDARLHLPASNTFIAESVDLKPIAAGNPAQPAALVQDKNLRIWYRQDDEFRVPKGAMYVNFKSPLVSSSPQGAAKSVLYVSLIRDAVNEYTYPAALAGLNFSLYKHGRGISLKISGYDDKQLVLLKSMVHSIATAQLDTARFDDIRADLIRDLENVKTMRPYSQVIGDGRELLLHSEWSEEQLIEVLQQVSPQQVQQFADKFWSEVQADVLLNGNYEELTAAGVRQALQPLLRNPKPAPLPDMKVVKLAAGSEFVYSTPVEHEDSVLFWYMQAPGSDWHNRAMAALSAQVLKSGFFQQLRTEQQLGYIVSAIYWPLLDVPGLAFLVQSPSASSVQVAEAVEQFLADTLADDGMTHEQFLRHRKALVSEILQPHKNLWEQSDSFWREIARHRLGFDSRQQLAAAVEAIEFDPWRQWLQSVAMEERAAVAFSADGRWGVHPSAAAVQSAAQFKREQQAYQVP